MVEPLRIRSPGGDRNQHAPRFTDAGDVGGARVATGGNGCSDQQDAAQRRGHAAPECRTTQLASTPGGSRPDTSSVFERASAATALRVTTVACSRTSAG